PPRIYDAHGQLVYDGYYLEPSICQLCLDDTTIAKVPSLVVVAVDKSNLHIVEILKPTNKWLYWSNGGSCAAILPNSIYVGSADGKTFYATSYAQFADFILRPLPLPVSPTRPTLAAVTVPSVVTVPALPKPSQVPKFREAPR